MTALDAVPGLASNTAAPASVLLRLLKFDHGWSTVTRLTHRASLPDEVAKVLLTHPERRVRGALAESAGADPALRARLLDGPASDAVLVACGPQPYGTAAPPLPDHAYARLLAHDDANVRYEMANAPSTPAHVLLPLATHEDPFFRRAACRRVWEELAPEVRGALLDDPDPEVRTAAALHVMADDEERTAWLVETRAGLFSLWEVLARGRLERGLAERLLAEYLDTDGTRLARLVGNPTFPADLAATLAGHEDPAVRLAVSARPELTEEQRAAVGWKVTEEDRLEPLVWVWRGRADAELLRRCARSAHTWLRRSAAVCAELPDDCVELLAGDEDVAVRLLLAERHPKAPPELLLDLYLHGTHRAVGMLTARPGFPSAGLAERFADAADPRERALTLRDPAATPELVERLSRDPDGFVRLAAAFDHRLSVNRIVELLDDPEVGFAAAANPLLPVAEMTALLDRAGVPG
ncbi:hypothetical protein P1P75_18665 [Streptomyces sp. ID05-39B]|uniref:hypothetical protein n=1 Tax=Streptomyces sp. ID05-39B TaxID=3028664 RepID=UPI0029A25ED4|nr:hypothetical protein [Streptomyces sp. ID05-39B]MDX3528408.1 hypothetical protein [Streptomyces sp. ID05-39B]